MFRHLGVGISLAEITIKQLACSFVQIHNKDEDTFYSVVPRLLSRNVHFSIPMKVKVVRKCEDCLF